MTNKLPQLPEVPELYYRWRVSHMQTRVTVALQKARSAGGSFAPYLAQDFIASNNYDETVRLVEHTAAELWAQSQIIDQLEDMCIRLPEQNRGY